MFYLNLNVWNYVMLMLGLLVVWIRLLGKYLGFWGGVGGVGGVVGMGKGRVGKGRVGKGRVGVREIYWNLMINDWKFRLMRLIRLIKWNRKIRRMGKMLIMRSMCSQ